MAKYPDRRSAAIPALHAAQERCTAGARREAIDAGRCRDAADARLPDLGGDLLRHVLDRAASRATTCTCARTSRARCSAPTSSSRRCWRAAEDDPTSTCASFECLGACDIAPMASVNGEYVGPLDARRRAADRRGPAGRPDRARAQAASLPRAAPIPASPRRRRVQPADLDDRDGRHRRARPGGHRPPGRRAIERPANAPSTRARGTDRTAPGRT